MLVKLPKRGPGWYLADFEVAKSVAGLPGVKEQAFISPDRPVHFELHRSHFPLIDHPAAVAELARVSAITPAWEARDQWAAELGFKPRTTQHQAVDYITNRRGTLLGDDMRLGKGGVLGTRLLGPNGWFLIDHAKIGDEIIGSDGKTHKITGVFHRGVLPIYKIKFSDGTSVRVDGEHLWPVWHHNDWHRGKPYRVLQTKDITKLRDAANNMQWRIPLVQPIQFAEREHVIDPYLLGVLLGDGSLSQITVSFCSGDELDPQEIAKLQPAGIELHRRDYSGQAATHWGLSRTDRAAPNLVRAALDKLGLRGVVSNTKFVPDEYLFASVEQRVALLQGLLDTDGEYCNGVLAFTSASQQLRDAVVFLAESLGGVARTSVKLEPKYTYKSETRIGKPSYKAVLSLPDWVQPFRARQGYQPRLKFKPARLIDSIEPDGIDEVICISVDAPDQLYVTEHCIVTHNTLSALMSHDPKDGPLVVIAPLQTRAVWLGWMRRLFPGVPIGVMTSKTFDRECVTRPIVFGHYDILPKWQTVMNIGTLVFDEAHLLTNKKTRRTEAAFLLNARAKRVIAMTGTPIWNMPPNLWAVLALVAPGAWGGYYDFCDRYAAPMPGPYGKTYTGTSNTDELRARMADIMLRRRWRDCLDDLPAISRSVIVAEVTDAERKKLDITMGSLRTDRTNTVGYLSAYRKQLSLIKAKAVEFEIAKIASAGEPCVVWTWHKETADRIARARASGDQDTAPPRFLIHGDIAPGKRDEIMDAWRRTPNGVLVATMSVAQVGIDLSHARIAIFAEIDYTPAVIAQTEMRTFPPGGIGSMDIRFVIANHIVDQRIIRALIAKLGAADPLGVGAAVDTIDALRDAIMGPRDDGDLDRLMEDFLASAA